MIDAWIEQDDYDNRRCHECLDNEKRMNNANDLIQSIVDQLYSKGNLDLASFEDDLDNLCYMFEIPMKKGDLQIQRKDEFINAFFDYTKQMIG